MIEKSDSTSLALATIAILGQAPSVSQAGKTGFQCVFLTTKDTKVTKEKPVES
jgi:hypothetical protein